MSRILEKPHSYGKHFHLIEDAATEAILARFCQASSKQPDISRYVRRMSDTLVTSAVQALFPRSQQRIKTRMSVIHAAEAEFSTELIDPEIKVVIVDLMRAGILPTQTIFETLHDFLKPENLRQDHILINRVTNDKEEVLGAKVSGHKIGGPIENAFVFFPDPMGATGGSILQVVELYKQLKLGIPKKFVALHFIVTPEYLKRTLSISNDLEIFALRVDRGMSKAEILKTPLGQRWDEERGLNAKHYIVPGAGGIGEVLNNSFV